MTTDVRDSECIHSDVRDFACTITSFILCRYCCTRPIVYIFVWLYVGRSL